MKLVGRPEIAEEPWFASGRGRFEHVEEIDAVVGAWIAEHSREEVLSAFNEAEAAIAPVYDARDIVEDPHVQAARMLVEVEDPELGTVMMHNVMWRMSKTPGSIRWTGRAMGADTDEVLGGELGLSAEDLAQLREAGVIK
jgi:crotonobetainyl-CoA:carnitine CoA-transferase CaiB-like acyl-CoA transferase